MTGPVCRSRPLCDCFAAFLLLTIVSTIFPSTSAAQTNSTWTGTTGSWSNSANWDNGVPNGSYNAFIGNGNTPIPTANLDINATVNELTLNSGGVLITAGNSLSVGTLAMSGTGSFVSGATGAEILNVGSIDGNGTISNVALSSVSSVNAFGGTLTIATSSQTSPPLNLRDVQVANGSTLNLTDVPLGGFDPSTGTLSGTSINIQGTLEFDNANITELAGIGRVTLNGPGAEIVNQFGQNALSNLQTINNGDNSLNLINGASLSTNQGLFTEAPTGTIGVSSGSSLSIGGQLFSQTDLIVDSSSLTVNGAVIVANGDAHSEFFIQNGSSLESAGGLYDWRSRVLML